jgi:hypothetical protein
MSNKKNDSDYIQGADVTNPDLVAWKEFQQTGLLLIINQFLHIFGYAISFDYDHDTNSIIGVKPIKVDFRGFGEESVTRAYSKVKQYLKSNIDEITKED